MLLLERGRAITYEEFDSLGLAESLERLRGIEGIVFLDKGATLNSDLRLELSRL